MTKYEFFDLVIIRVGIELVGLVKPEAISISDDMKYNVEIGTKRMMRGIFVSVWDDRLEGCEDIFQRAKAVEESKMLASEILNLLVPTTRIDKDTLCFEYVSKFQFAERFRESRKVVKTDNFKESK